jgi:uncharacterized membrane protein
MQRLKSLWESIRTSLWAVPLAMTIAACALAVVTTGIRIDVGNDPVWFLYSGDAQEAPQFLGDLMTAMITMATLAISITMVVLTLAAQQLGPRLIRNFMSDLRTQYALGLFFATVIYLILVLRAAYGAGDSAPNLAVTVGTVLALISVLGLMLFVHHLARAIVSDTVIRWIGAQLDREIARLLPEKDADAEQPLPESVRNAGRPLKLKAGGYIQSIDFERLAATACRHDVRIELDVRAGHHTVAQCCIGWIAPSARSDEKLDREIADCILLGTERTPLQDLEFSVRQLVEIAVRAMSPSINDPFTAITVIDRLSLSLCCVMGRGNAPRVHTDDNGTVRLVHPVSTFDGIVDAAFHQIRQVSGDMPAVLIRMAEALAQLHELADAKQRDGIERHLRLVLAAGRRNIAEPTDLAVLEARVGDAAPELVTSAAG